MEEKTYGHTRNGEEVKLFTLKNQNGLIARVSNFGAAITELHAPDRNGQCRDITLGFPSLEGYLKNEPFLGVVAGRFANRIAKGVFRIDGKCYELATNNGPNHLHGGNVGFNHQLWQVRSQPDAPSESVQLTYLSSANEEGYPGELRVQLRYTLTEENELVLEYEAASDQATPVNLTNHAYWNLRGEGTGQIHDHRLTLHARFYTPTDDTLIPTGAITPVESTPLDFLTPTPIGERIDGVGSQPTGYDHNFVLDKSEEGALELAATVQEPNSGRRMDVFTTEPGLQLYTGNFLDGTITGKQGQPYESQDGFCLECQHFPDSPNHPHFPSTILRPGTVYRQTTVHRFSVERPT